MFHRNNQLALNEIAWNLLVGVACTWVGLEKLAVEVGSLELWARKAGDSVRVGTGNWASSILHDGQNAVELVDTTGHSSAESEACKVVALEQSSAVEGTACQIRNVEASEGVGCASVTTDAESVWVGLGAGEQVNKNIWEIVGIGSVAAVPVARNALLAAVVDICAWVVARCTLASTADCEEILEYSLVEISTWLLGGVVGHEVDND